MKQIRFTFFPSSPNWRNNPYLDLLQQALEQEGGVFIPPESDYPTGRWLFRMRMRGHLDVLHFHWIQYHYAGSRGWLSLARFGLKLVFARLLGYRLVWTMHNLLPHESDHPRLDRLARWWITRISHAVIVHCAEGRRQLAGRFGRRRRVYEAPLGTYAPILRHLPDRQRARLALGLADDLLVFLFFGGIRRHKGFEELAAAFMRLSGPHARLLVVGRPFESDLERFLQDCVGKDPRIITCLGYADDVTFQQYLGAADVAVLPFKQVLTSSSVMTALAAGLPVIVPALGCLPELVADNCGQCYDPAGEKPLFDAMQAALGWNIVAMSTAAKRRAAQFNWQDAARATLRAYEVA